MGMAADVEAMNQGFAAFNAGDHPKALSIFHEDCAWVDAPELPGATTWRGHEGLLACWESWTDVWGRVTMEPIEYVNAGGGVYVISQAMRATGAGSETPIEMTLWSVVRFEEGKARRVTFHLTADAARDAAGLVS